jgi:hypothetical protein
MEAAKDMVETSYIPALEPTWSLRAQHNWFMKFLSVQDRPTILNTSALIRLSIVIKAYFTEIIPNRCTISCFYYNYADKLYRLIRRKGTQVAGHIVLF